MSYKDVVRILKNEPKLWVTFTKSNKELTDFALLYGLLEDRNDDFLYERARHNVRADTVLMGGTIVSYSRFFYVEEDATVDSDLRNRLQRVSFDLFKSDGYSMLVSYANIMSNPFELAVHYNFYLAPSDFPLVSKNELLTVNNSVTVPEYCLTAPIITWQNMKRQLRVDIEYLI